MEKIETIEPFQATLRHLVWALIEDWVKEEIKNQVKDLIKEEVSNSIAETTLLDELGDNKIVDSDDFSEKVNELISDYFTYNVSVSIDH